MKSTPLTYSPFSGKLKFGNPDFEKFKQNFVLSHNCFVNQATEKNFIVRRVIKGFSSSISVFIELLKYLRSCPVCDLEKEKGKLASPSHTFRARPRHLGVSSSLRKLGLVDHQAGLADRTHHFLVWGLELPREDCVQDTRRIYGQLNSSGN